MSVVAIIQDGANLKVGDIGEIEKVMTIDGTDCVRMIMLTGKLKFKKVTIPQEVCGEIAEVHLKHFGEDS